MRKNISITFAILIVMVVITSNIYATNGYFSHGYGTQHKALAGVGVALPLNSLTAATNPAGMVFVGKRYDFGLAVFNPNREYTVTGNPSGYPDTFPLAPGTIESDSKMFLIPSIGANWMLNPNSSVGVSIYGNGGMNTDYNTETFGFKPAGVDLTQLFVAPTYARKLAANHALGITAILGYQRFEAKGLNAFAMFSSDGTKLTDNDYDNAFGFGARIGYLGNISSSISIGASYQTKIYMSEFDDYAGLFAEQGDFDIPANWTVGIVYKMAAFTIGIDMQQILYSGIKSINNPLMTNIQASQLGNDDGAGFGWEDMTVYKFGIQYPIGPGWIWRIGYSYGKQPIPDSEVMFNILAPGVIEQHITCGFSKTIGTHELSFSLMRGLSNSVSGANPMEAPGQQTIELTMNQWEFEIGFSF